MTLVGNPFDSLDQSDHVSVGVNPDKPDRS